MRFRFIHLTLCILLLPSFVGSARGATAPNLCDFLKSGPPLEQTHHAKGSFRKAIRPLKRGQWVRANQRMNQAYDELEDRVQALFHPADDQPADRKDIERFLNEHLYGKQPELVMGANDFYLHPTIALAWAQIECRAGVKPSRWRSLVHLERGAHPIASLARAISLLAAGQPLPPGLRRNTGSSLSFTDSVIEALHTLNDTDKSAIESAIERVQTVCLGPSQCAWTSWLRRAASLEKEAK